MNTTRIAFLHTGWIGLALLAACAERGYRRLPEVPAGTSETPVTIVIPARDEAVRLPALLASIGATPVIVVDDDSSDDTALVAKRAGARLIRTEGPPMGWTGKNAACWAGASQVTTPWILFLDADVTLRPGSVTALVKDAEQQGLVALSIFPQQRVETLFERLIVPIAYQVYGMGHRNRGRVANGQVFLVRRDAYQRVGGHAAIRSSVIDDVALAERLAQAGPVGLARGERWAEVRMYDSLPAIADGFGKNAARFLLRDPLGGAFTVAGSVLGTIGPGMLLTGLARHDGQRALAGLLAIVTGILGLVPWMRRFGLSGWWAVTQPIGATLMQLIAIRSALAMAGVFPARWKGRRV